MLAAAATVDGLTSQKAVYCVLSGETMPPPGHEQFKLQGNSIEKPPHDAASDFNSSQLASEVSTLPGKTVTVKKQRRSVGSAFDEAQNGVETPSKSLSSQVGDEKKRPELRLNEPDDTCQLDNRALKQEAICLGSEAHNKALQEPRAIKDSPCFHILEKDDCTLTRYPESHDALYHIGPKETIAISSPCHGSIARLNSGSSRFNTVAEEETYNRRCANESTMKKHDNGERVSTARETIESSRFLHTSLQAMVPTTSLSSSTDFQSETLEQKKAAFKERDCPEQEACLRGEREVEEGKQAEIQRLRENIQELCKAINSLGKCIGGLQEDAEMMNKEYQYWIKEREDCSFKLKLEQRITKEKLQKHLGHIAQLEDDIHYHQERNNSLKTKVLENDNRIINLLKSISLKTSEASALSKTSN